jgi:virginiamycin B lyase
MDVPTAACGLIRKGEVLKKTVRAVALLIAVGAVTGVVVAAATAKSSGVTTDTRAIRPVATIATLPSPRSLVAASGAIWYPTPTGVQRVDPATNKVTATVPIPSDCCPSIAAGAGAVWVASFDKNVVRRIDPATSKVKATIKAGPNPAGLAATKTAVWVTEHRGGTISRIDPTTNRIVATVKIGPRGTSGPQPVAVAFGDVWVGVSNISALVRVDARTNRVKARVAFPSNASPCGTIIATTSALWVSGCGEVPTIAQVDPRTNKVVNVVRVAGASGDAVIQDGRAWYGAQSVPIGSDCPCHPRLVRLEPGKHVPTAVRTLPRSIPDQVGLLKAFGALWLTDPTGNTLRRFPAHSLK